MGLLAGILGWVAGDWLGEMFLGDGMAVFVLAFTLSVLGFVLATTMVRLRAVGR